MYYNRQSAFILIFKHCTDRVALGAIVVNVWVNQSGFCIINFDGIKHNVSIILQDVSFNEMM